MVERPLMCAVPSLRCPSSYPSSLVLQPPKRPPRVRRSSASAGRPAMPLPMRLGWRSASGPATAAGTGLATRCVVGGPVHLSSQAPQGCAVYSSVSCILLSGDQADAGAARHGWRPDDADLKRRSPVGRALRMGGLAFRNEDRADSWNACFAPAPAEDAQIWPNPGWVCPTWAEFGRFGAELCIRLGMGQDWLEFDQTRPNIARN